MSPSGAMIDLRIYRAALIPAAVALAVLMFSLQGRPEPLNGSLAPEAFDGARAAALAGRIDEMPGSRAPGSPGTTAVARMVERRFRAIDGGQVAVQRFSGSFAGTDRQFENVSVVLPGSSDRRLVLMAPRDGLGAAGRAAAAASTAGLLEATTTLSQARRRRTFVLVSTDGSSAGAAGAREFAERTDAEGLDGVVVLEQPGLRQSRTPFVVPWSAGPQSAGAQLVQGARSSVRAEVGRDPGGEGTIGHFLRLALPVGVQEQLVLNERGFDAVTLTSGGDLPGSRTGPADSAERLGEFGRAAVATLLGLDSSASEPEQGPGAYVPLAGQLIPGWALELVALTLLLPPAVTSIDGLARARRKREPVLAWLGWVLSAAAPLAGVLVLAYLMALVDLIPRPPFPFDPARFGLDAAAVAALVVLTALAVAGTVRAWPRLAPDRVGSVAGQGPALAVVFVLSVTLLALWVANPFLALLLVPAAHLWLFAALPELELRPAAAVTFALAGGVPILVGIAYVAVKLGVGLAVPWQLVLMVTGGHVSVFVALLTCVLAGCLLSAFAVSLARRLDRGGSRFSAAGSAPDPVQAEPTSPEPSPAATDPGLRG
ncbi:MAG: hypothetical protein ACR2NA_12090 [Solirubrobacterales bacterium]